jgi:5-methylcytosine-specific restriction endonuclease McrA
LVHFGFVKMEQVLLLNITFEPLKVINWKKAIIMLTLGKVEVIEEYTREVHSVSFAIKLPAVVRLLRFVKRPTIPVRFSRQNIYIRDDHKCQYCGKRLTPDELTWDHVLPRARGGKTEWKNVVTCCIECNRKKGGRVPSEASMVLIKKPSIPEWLPILKVTLHFKHTPQSWRDYIYWNVELEE